MVFTKRRRKFVEEKTTTELKSKQTSITTVRNRLRTVAQSPCPPPFSLTTTFKECTGMHLLTIDIYRLLLRGRGWARTRNLTNRPAGTHPDNLF